MTQFEKFNIATVKNLIIIKVGVDFSIKKMGFLSQAPEHTWHVILNLTLVFKVQLLLYFRVNLVHTI